MLLTFRLLNNTLERDRSIADNKLTEPIQHEKWIIISSNIFYLLVPKEQFWI
ncbi:hypothetical protein Ngar_c35410 [Candidatus Nitrososphaera gargensis Ga9.2]|uniref:Uncharacterized protein n=1 Tax=Nitrososphaera gargensis (strain Ga9.2) TaxID=1237085 RepID=K0IP39_NITGG|nr:hypothetical protein Ngar_c35410 [Candidatus Nitrososphaera gargensis Ga9.2]